MSEFNKLFAALAVSSLVLIGCGDDDPVADGGVDSGTDAAVTLRGAANPPTVAAGSQVDRVGRAAISTGTIATFTVDETARNTVKDNYNAAEDASAWVAAYTDDIEESIAILDGLDENCGNQFAFDTDYSGLASILADDRLFINAAATSCTNYLAVEAGETDCGGRTPNYDVMDVTYSILVVGAPTGVSDGVTADDVTHSDTVFPFFAAPAL